MDTLLAFANGEANRHKEKMVFDWDKAARIILEHNPPYVEAGLEGDFEWTGGCIWRDGQIVKEYTYLASTWARPQLCVEGELIDCFKMQSECPDWNEKTNWPDSAIQIVSGHEKK